ncbi:membrane protein [Xanthomonas citri pv. mangiferaeindicae]|nr:membrane protein [Xanthomonas citri pv. mangiferaeindicae]
MDTAVVYYVLATALVLIGLAGVVLPALPGLPLVFAGLLVAAWADNFTHIGWVTLVVLGLITALSYLVDFLATLYGAQRVGASKMALWGSVIGGIAGIFFMPIGLFRPVRWRLAGRVLPDTQVRPGHEGRDRHLGGHHARHRHQAGARPVHAGRVRHRLVFLGLWKSLRSVHALFVHERVTATRAQWLTRGGAHHPHARVRATRCKQTPS